MGGKGQVSMYVIAGLFLVMLLFFGLSLRDRTSVVEQQTPNQEILRQENPELAAEIARMQSRVDTCLKQVSEHAVDELLEAMPEVTQVEAAAALEELIALEFPSCFYAFNTKEKLVIADPAPEVSVTLGPTTIVSVDFATTGHFGEETYTMRNYQARVPTTVELDIARRDRARQEFEASLAGIGSSTFIDEDGYYNPYALETENIYTDAMFFTDGSCVILFYDYNGDELRTYSQYYDKCTTGA